MQARFVLNEGAGGLLDADGTHLSLDVQAGEKVYQDFTLETTHPGGHSSRPDAREPDQPCCRPHSRASAHTSFRWLQFDRRAAISRRRPTWRRPSCRRHAGHRREPATMRRGAPAVDGESELERHAAHDLRSDAVLGRPRAQCIAAARASTSIAASCRASRWSRCAQTRSRARRRHDQREFGDEMGLAAPAPPLTAEIMEPVRGTPANPYGPRLPWCRRCPPARPTGAS